MSEREPTYPFSELTEAAVARMERRISEAHETGSASAEFYADDVLAALRAAAAGAAPGDEYVSHNGLVNTLLLLYRGGPNTGYGDDVKWLPEQRVAVIAMLNLLAQLHPSAVAALRAADRGPTAIPFSPFANTEQSGGAAPGDGPTREQALDEAARACEAIRDECYQSWQSFAEDEQRKGGKAAARAERAGSEAYYAYETANDCAKAIRALGGAAPASPGVREAAAIEHAKGRGQRVNKPMLDQALRELAEMQEGTPGGYAAPEPLLTEEERATLRAIAAKREVAGWSEAGLLRRLLASEAQAQDGLRYAREEAARAAQVAVEVEEKLARAHAEAETLRGALAKLVNHRAHRSKGCTICDPARALSVRPPADPPKGDETG